jgi:hypothetical protein
MEIAEHKSSIPKSAFGCTKSNIEVASVTEKHSTAGIPTTILATAALLTGGIIYILWRGESLRMFSWFNYLGVGQLLHVLRAHAAPYAHAFPSWVYSSLPEALWLLSGTLYFRWIWRNGSAFSYVLWTSLFIAIAIGSELGQYVHVVPGCFDITDLLLLIAACVPACILILFRFRTERTVSI